MLYIWSRTFYLQPHRRKKNTLSHVFLSFVSFWYESRICGSLDATTLEIHVILVMSYKSKKIKSEREEEKRMHLWGKGNTDRQRESLQLKYYPPSGRANLFLHELSICLSLTYTFTPTHSISHIYIHKISRSHNLTERQRRWKERYRQALHIPITQSLFCINAVFVCVWQSWAHCLVKLHRLNLFALSVHILQVFNLQWNPEQCILWQAMICWHNDAFTGIYLIIGPLGTNTFAR